MRNGWAMYKTAEKKRHSVYNSDHKFNLPYESYIPHPKYFTRGANSCNVTSHNLQNP